MNLKDIVIAVLLTSAVGYVYSLHQYKEGVQVGKDSAQVEFNLKQELIDEQRRIALEATAKELANLEIKNVTIHQKAIKEVTTDVLYRDCIVPDNGLRVLKEASKPR